MSSKNASVATITKNNKSKNKATIIKNESSTKKKKKNWKLCKGIHLWSSNWC
jgi:hypothetical protein